MGVNQHITYVQHLPALIGPKANEFVEEVFNENFGVGSEFGFKAGLITFKNHNMIFCTSRAYIRIASKTRIKLTS